MIVLPAENPQVVKAYVHWLYASSLPMLTETGDATFELLAQAYVFGDGRMDAKFCNAVIHSSVSATIEHKCLTADEAFKIVFEGSAPGCGGRRILVEFIAAQIQDGPELDQQIESDTGEMMTDVMKAITRLRPQQKTYPWILSTDTYLEKLT